MSDPQHSDFLRAWIDSGTLQQDQANYIRTWFDKGLQDWCISRDGPYFGFPIPEMRGDRRVIRHSGHLPMPLWESEEFSRASATDAESLLEMALAAWLLSSSAAVGAVSQRKGFIHLGRLPPAHETMVPIPARVVSRYSK